MDTALLFFDAAKGPLGPVLAIGVAAAIYMYSQRNASRKDAADAGGQIGALAVYKELLDRERVARQQDVERADKLDAELRIANNELWSLRGQFKAMGEQLAAQTLQVEQLRKQLDLLQERVVHGG